MNEQAIPTPFGVSVFGSAVVRAEPDFATLRFSVNCLEKVPKDAFGGARDRAQRVRAVLGAEHLDEVTSSRVTLTQTIRFVAGEQRLEGYTATVGFSAILRDLERIEAVLTGVIDAGADKVTAVELGTTSLKELRQRARQEAVAAAREKAENYAQAAGVKLGRVLHIEDVDPERLRGSEGHFARGGASDTPHALEPGLLSIGGAVVVGFSIEP